MEVHLRPEQEAYIESRIRKGRFTSANEALREAVGLLQQSDRDHEEDASDTAFGSGSRGSMGNELISVMQACPYPDVDLEPTRVVMPVRKPAF